MTHLFPIYRLIPFINTVRLSTRSESEAAALDSRELPLLLGQGAQGKTVQRDLRGTLLNAAFPTRLHILVAFPDCVVLVLDFEVFLQLQVAVVRLVLQRLDFLARGLLLLHFLVQPVPVGPVGGHESLALVHQLSEGVLGRGNAVFEPP